MSGRASDPAVLIVAADSGLRSDLGTLLDGHHPVTLDGEGLDALDLLDRQPSLKVVLLVEEEPASQATLDLVSQITARGAGVSVLVLSRHPSLAHATEAIRRGAVDFLAVPYSPEQVRKQVERVLETAALRNDVHHLRTLVSSALGLDQLVSHSPCMRPVLQRAQAAAHSTAPVLIIGETGTGKELIARGVHAASARHAHPFVPVNCAALPHDLVESELFGHRRGAFSGAVSDHQGLFAAAHRGTILLDEVAELPPGVQAKLLRVLQDGEIRSVGSSETRSVDVRVIAATNRRYAELRAGALRPDFFFRVSVLVIEIPPLRERPEDVVPLIRHFFRQRCGCDLSARYSFEPAAVDLLHRHPFPGNVRELENLVQGLCVTLPPGRTVVKADDVRAWLRRLRGTPGLDGEMAPDASCNLRELEAWAVRTALDRSHGNKSRAALMLGISRESLYRKLEEIEQRSRTAASGTGNNET